MKFSLALVSIFSVGFSSNALAGYYSSGDAVSCTLFVSAGNYPEGTVAAVNEFRVENKYTRTAVVSKKVSEPFITIENEGVLTPSEQSLLNALKSATYSVEVSYRYPKLTVSVTLPNGEFIESEAERNVTSGAYHNNSASDAFPVADFSNSKYLKQFGFLDNLVGHVLCQ